MYSEHHRLEKQRQATERWRHLHEAKWIRRRIYELNGEQVEMSFYSTRGTGDYGKATPKVEADKARRISLLMLLGGTCKCGMSDYRCLQIDHVNGGGCNERSIDSYKQNSIAAVWHGALQGNLQALCANCNWIKRYEQNEHRSISKKGQQVA